MGRHRVPIVPAFDDWQVITLSNGRLAIVDSEGLDPFRHPDRLVRLEAFYVAAQASPLRACAKELARVLELNVLGGSHGYRPLLEFCHLRIALSRPPAEQVSKIIPVRFQQDLDLEAA